MKITCLIICVLLLLIWPGRFASGVYRWRLDDLMKRIDVAARARWEIMLIEQGALGVTHNLIDHGLCRFLLHAGLADRIENQVGCRIDDIALREAIGRF